MKSMVQHLWLIPTLPLLAAGISALLKQRQRMLAASLAIGSMILSLALSGVAFANALHHPWQGEGSHQVVNFSWFEFAAANGGAFNFRLVVGPPIGRVGGLLCVFPVLIFFYHSTVPVS